MAEKKSFYQSLLKSKQSGSKPKKAKLYEKVKAAAKRKFDVYPSAVANAWLTKEYKRKGGTYKD
jgi:aryl-alcohol dehydrogenase-like predicted oxidoreductase